MRFAAVHRAFLREAPAVLASASALGSWLRVASYASEIECGGLVPDAAAFDDRRWLSLAALTRAEVNEAVAAGLCVWEEDDLRVLGYDLDGEAKVRACRTNGTKGGRPPKVGQKTQAKPNGKPRGNHPVNPGETKRLTKTVTKTKPLSLPYLREAPSEEDLAGLERALLDQGAKAS